MARKKGSEAVIATEQQGNGLGMAVCAGEGVAPYFMMDVEVHGPTGLRWRDGISHNIVVDRGAEYALNRVFGFETASTFGPYAMLHSATVASGNVWSQVSASRVISFGNNIPAVTFATNAAGNGTRSVSQSFSYSFNASTQTVSGCAFLFYTTNTMSTNFATADGLMYAYGTFSNGSRQVQLNDTLNATVTFSFGTA